MDAQEFERKTAAIMDTLNQAIVKLAKIRNELEYAELPEDLPMPEDFPPMEQLDQQREESVHFPF